MGVAVGTVTMLGLSKDGIVDVVDARDVDALLASEIGDEVGRRQLLVVQHVVVERRRVSVWILVFKLPSCSLCQRAQRLLVLSVGG